MIKKTFVIIFIAILSFSCGKKGNPIYNQENQGSKILSIRQIVFS